MTMGIGGSGSSPQKLPASPDINIPMDSLNTTLDVGRLHEANQEKLQLEQLAGGDAGELGADQLDQLLIDFANKKDSQMIKSAATNPSSMGLSPPLDKVDPGATLQGDTRFIVGGMPSFR